MVDSMLRHNISVRLKIRYGHLDSNLEVLEMNLLVGHFGVGVGQGCGVVVFSHNRFISYKYTTPTIETDKQTFRELSRL